MKINSYQIGMDSAGTYRSMQTRKYSLSYAKEDSNSTGTSFLDRFDDIQTGLNDRIKEVDRDDGLKNIEQVRERFVLYLWRMFFGSEKADEMADRFGISRLDPSDQLSPARQNQSLFSVIRIEGIQEVYFEESQDLNFRSAGNVTTSDGRSIDFNLDIAMSSSFSSYYREEVSEIAAMCDPLVLNFSGDIADLCDTKFYFDLDCDGKEDSISQLADGNGFLALDKNGDGKVNDGSELFGTVSGDGFADLAKYDSDHNGWIDENDDIFDSLRIWIKDETGNDSLFSLKDKNVGAIYLGNVDTGFGLRSITSGNMNGMVKRTGVFLYEDGSGVSTISHLDIAN